MLELRKISKRYKGFGAVKDVSLSFQPGEIVGLFGENGAGKSTLMKCMIGATSFSGEVLVDGEKLSHKNAGKIAYASCEHTTFPMLTGNGHKKFMMEQFPDFNEKRFDVLMDFFGLNRTKSIKYFSKGQRDQFEVILALCQGAKYIILDEPFVGNDIFNRQDFYKILLGIIEEDETIILSTHLIEEVDNFVSRVVLMHKSEIINDAKIDDLEEAGTSIIDFINENYHYEGDRARKASVLIAGE